MAIVTLEEFREFCGTTSVSKDSLLEAALGAAEREVLNFCHRSSGWTGFEGSTGTRYYRADDIVELPYGSQYAVPGTAGIAGSRRSWDQWGGGSPYPVNSYTVLWLGDADLQSVDTLTNGDGTAVSSTSYWLEPRNQRPYRYIRLKTDESWSFNTDGEIEVAGTWGYTTAPDGTVKWAVKETGKFLMDSRTAQVYDVTAMPDIGQITVPKGMPQHVKVALTNGNYRRSLRVY